jgi:adenylate kinase
LVQEYRDSRGLWPIKIVIHGPPGSGKTFFSEKIAEFYKIHYLEPEAIVSEAISQLEQRVNNPQHNPEDETDIQEDKDMLNEIRETLKSNNGKLPSRLTVSFIRDKVRSMPCRNQGYILDGFPTNMDEANDLLRRIKILT